MRASLLIPLCVWIYACIPGTSSLFAQDQLNKEQADDLSLEHYQAQLQILKPAAERALEKRGVSFGTYFAKMGSTIWGEKPINGRSLYISLHGGGNAPKEVNDQQYANQLRLYTPKEGVYLALRAPTDTWNLWHEAHIDNILDSVIKYHVILHDVNPNKVYLMGYSAGGDGVYQLAPRMADRWAAAAMMAGHPGDADMRNLRNLPFTIHMGALDAAYDRNILATTYGNKLDSLQQLDPNGYIHETHVYKDMPHWMDRKDTIALDWMAQYVRNPLPDRIIWIQDDRIQHRFYWLQVPDNASVTPGNIADIRINGNTIELVDNDYERLYINLNDRLLDLEKEVIVKKGDQILFSKKLPRTRKIIEETVSLYQDPDLIFSARLIIEGGDKVSSY